MLEKKTLLVSGGTGTGKTTFLNACLQLIPAHERLITLEDTREVQVKHLNAVHLLFQPEDPTRDALTLFKAALRLRPDRILLSELRGQEVWPFLRAIQSGHPGSLSTLHAEDPKACYDQLLFMLQQAGLKIQEKALIAYLKQVIPIVMQLKRGSDGEGRVKISAIYYSAME